MKDVKSFLGKALSSDKDVSIKRVLMLLVTLSLLVLLFVNPKHINSDVVAALCTIDCVLIAGNVVGGFQKADREYLMHA